MEQQQKPNPVEWCERMRDTAPDGDTAYHYHQLADSWRRKTDE